MLRLSLLFASIALAGSTALAQTPATLLPDQSEITFTTRQMGVPVEGRFGRYGAQIALDPKRPDGGRVAIDIDTASARFGSAELDGEVGKPVWLAAARFPQASFRSSRIQSTAAGQFEVAGTLTIKGHTREIRVPVQLTSSGATHTARGSFTIRRLEFAVGEGEWTDTSLLANEVLVRFKLALSGLAPP